jgi:transcriptional repressor OPI1
MPRREVQSNGHAPTGVIPSTAGAATQAAQRILTLSTESLDMMRGVTAVVKESLDRADA